MTAHCKTCVCDAGWEIFSHHLIDFLIRYVSLTLALLTAVAITQHWVR